MQTDSSLCVCVHTQTRRHIHHIMLVERFIAFNQCIPPMIVIWTERVFPVIISHEERQGVQ